MEAALTEIRADAAARRFDAWGSSTVADELTGTPVLDRERFDALHTAARIPARFPIGNAGVIHVYGYWFSTTPTPFGLKRDRWLEGRLASALGLPVDAFHLRGGEATTLLQRVTTALLPVLLDPTGADAPADSADVRVDDLATRVVVRRAAGATCSALIYGVDAGDGLRLVTAFPVDGDPEPMLADARAHPRLRWNAVDPRDS